ncbi:hypothetical protein [Prauserella alba]|nr:hypothetical protein [Prauserella alba]
MDELDWFWRNFIGEDGEGLYSALVEPITGDFNRIAENGEAWQHCATQFQSLSRNLTDNTASLVANHWTSGEASESYHQFVEITWVGALWIAEELCIFIGKGFEKVSEWSVKLAQKAIEIIETIVEAILKLAKKVVPVLGQVAGAVEWIASGFEDFPYISDVARIKDLIEQVYNIHNKIEQMANTIRSYLNACQGMMDAARAIPEINSSQDMIEITRTLSSGQQDMKEQKEAYQKQKKQLNNQINSLDRTLNPEDYKDESSQGN